MRTPERCTHSARPALVLALAVLSLAARPDASAARQRQAVQLDGELGIGTTYDTNLEHRPAGIETFGLDAGAEARLRIRTGRFSTSLQYAISMHRYETFPERNRTSHDSRLVIDLAASPGIGFRTTAAGSVAGLSEDREVGTEYGIAEALHVRFDQRNRIRISAAYSQRRYGERSGRDAANWSAGIGYSIGSRDGLLLVLESKYDRNETRDARSAFRRWTHRVDFQAPIAGSRLEVGIRRIAREYPQRMVALEDVADLELSPHENDLLEAYERETGTPRSAIPASELMALLSDRWHNLPRRDEIWAPSVSLVLMQGRGIEIELGYAFEARLSTDLRRGYSGHATRISSRLSI